MRAILTSNRLNKMLVSKPASTTKEEWGEIDEKALIEIQLSFTNQVLCEIINHAYTTNLWLKLQHLYITN